MVMSDPADEVDDDRAKGAFAVQDTAPPGRDGVAAEAFMAQNNDDGTTVTIRLTGLEPDTECVSHLHLLATRFHGARS